MTWAKRRTIRFVKRSNVNTTCPSCPVRAMGWTPAADDTNTEDRGSFVDADGGLYELSRISIG